MRVAIIKKGIDIVFAKRLFLSMQNFLFDLEVEYPFFLRWLYKVFEELQVSDKRIILICCDDNNIFAIRGVAILKNTSEERKICTLRVLPSYRHQGIGTTLLRKATEVLNDPYPLITVSGIHMDSFGPFLKKNGFVIKDKIKSLYKRGCYEYFYNIPYKYEVALISIRPEFVNKIMEGCKTVEFRKKVFSETVRKVVIYSSSPKKLIVGYFLVTNIVCNSPSEIWNRYKLVGGIDKERYDEYFKGHHKAFAIEIKQFVPFTNPLNPYKFDVSFRPPQSFCYVDNVEFLNWLNINNGYNFNNKL